MAKKVSYSDLAEGNPLEPLIESGKELVKVYESIVAVQKDVLAGTKEQAKSNSFGSIGDINDATTALKNAKKEADALAKSEQQLKEATDRLAQAQAGEVDELTKTKLATQAANTETKRLAKEHMNLGSIYDQQSAKLNNMRRAYKDLALQNKENTAEGKALLASVTKLDEELKKIDATVGQHQRNVGNYTSALEGLPGPLGNATTTARTFGQTLKALAMNPIVAIVTLLVVGLYLLAKAFTATDSGGDKFAKMLQTISAIMDVLMQRAGMLAKAFVSLFSGDFTGAATQFGEAVSGVGEQLNSAAEAANRYAEAIDRLEEAETAYISTRAENENKIAKLEFEAANRTLSVEARKLALEEAIRLGETESQKQVEFAKRKLDAEIAYQAGVLNISEDGLRRLIEANDVGQQILIATDTEAKKAREHLSDDTFKNLEGLFAATLEADTKFYNENKRNQSRLTGFEETVRKEREAKAKAYRDGQIKSEKEYQDLLIENMEDGFEKQMAVENLSYSRRKEELAGNYKALEQLEILHQKNLAEIIKNRGEVPEAIESMQRDVDDVLKSHQKTQQKLLTTTVKVVETETQKQARRLLAQQKRMAEELVKVAEFADQFAQKQADKRIKRIDEEVAASKKRADDLRQLALQGDKNAQQSIAAEEKRQAELERRREKEAQKAKRRELLLTGINTYNAKVQAGDKNALGSTLRDLTLLAAALNAIPGFIEGTENVARDYGRPQRPGKDGYLARFDGDERILSPDQNGMIDPNLSNDQLANIANMYQKGMLLPASRSGAMYAVQGPDMSEVVQKLDQVNKNIQNMPDHSLVFDEILGIITHTKRIGQNSTVTKWRA